MTLKLIHAISIAAMRCDYYLFIKTWRLEYPREEEGRKEGRREVTKTKSMHKMWNILKAIGFKKRLLQIES